MSRSRASGDPPREASGEVRPRRSVTRPPSRPAAPPARADYPSPTHAPEYQHMLARLRDVRSALGLSQAEVGRRLGRTDQFVSKSETGERRLDPIDLWRFARVYGRPVADFLPDAPDLDAPAAEAPAADALGSRPPDSA